MNLMLLQLKTKQLTYMLSFGNANVGDLYVNRRVSGENGILYVNRRLLENGAIICKLGF